MAKPIMVIDFERVVTIKSVAETGIVFSDGSTLSYVHQQDCCENVYADFEAIKDELYTIDSFSKLIVSRVLGCGIRLHFGLATYSVGYLLIPCYNQQNGYYNSNINLLFDGIGFAINEDISDCVKDEIY